MLNCLCASRFGLGWAHDVTLLCTSHIHAFSSICTLHLVYFYIFELFGAFLIVSFFPLPLLFMLVHQWHQIVNLLCPRSLYVLGPPLSSNPTPSSIQLRDGDAQKDFSKNVSRWGVHSECRVIMANFANTDLPDVIHSRGWESLCDVLVTCPSVLIPEFYFNMHKIDSSVPLFHTRVRGTRIVITPKLVFDLLRVLRVKHLD